MGPLIQKYCIGCHTAPNAAAGLALDSFKDSAGVLKEQELWQRVQKNVDSRHMPPASAPQPTDLERHAMSAWIDQMFKVASCDLRDPGRVTIRRLNRQEYNNTVRDLCGVDIHPADKFPSDDVGYGFDNIGDVLSLSPLLMEKYLAAAELVARAAVIAPEDSALAVTYDPAKFADSIGGTVLPTGGRQQTGDGEMSFQMEAARDGDYNFSISAAQDEAGPDPAHMIVRIDGEQIMKFDVRNRVRNPRAYTLPVRLKAGTHKVGIAYDNDFFDQNAPAGKRDRNLYVFSVEAHGPPGLPVTLPASHRRIVFVQPDPSAPDVAARKIMGEFARRAYRRPVTPAEVQRLVSYVGLARKQGESFERGIQLGMEAVLVNPNFLFRMELDSHPNDPGSHRVLGGYELATRLSYFLWSSMPDDELFRLAANGTLKDPAVLAAQVKRMLKDPRAHSLADNFAGQWLQLRNLATVSPDRARFPDFDDTLRAAMKSETEMFFEAIVQEDRSILDFIDGKFTYLNEPLARHYGIEGVTGEKFRRVVLTGSQRSGILTQASVLTVTSNPTRTSPVKRGKWVLEQMLADPPPPPPPNVPTLPDDKKGPVEGTLRHRLEEHRKNPICASCHMRMDPLGFGLENFDAVGRWRTQDGGSDIDSSGVLPSGQSFKGPGELKQILRTKKTQFATCLAQKLLTYGLGRGLESYDKCVIADVVKTTARSDYRFSALITAIVESDPFRKRRGDGGTL